MTDISNLALHLAIAPLKSTKEPNYAIWVTKAPYTSSYTHIDRVWPSSLTEKWIAWQEMFSLQEEIHIPIITTTKLGGDFQQSKNYGGQLMQELGVNLWEWIFEKEIGKSLAQSQGISIAQNEPLRLRLDIRDANLIPLPWEIMQENRGKQAISLNEKILFSRTTHDVTPLITPPSQDCLKILLVLGVSEWENEDQSETLPDLGLSLKEESVTLNQVIINSLTLNYEHFLPSINNEVKTLVKPTPQELISTLETGNYNIIFYAGHGQPGPDGGVLFLRHDASINGTELAQVLVRNQIILAVFNACWGAQPDLYNQTTIHRSSLAEVLIHHGVPAVLAMRDAIANEEAITFIQAFTKSLCERSPIDQAVAIARQQLLTIYKFNQPAWTLPILYLHPEFSGELMKPINNKITQLPELLTVNNKSTQIAYLRSLNNPNLKWPIHGGLMRVGRSEENDVIILERWVSQKHAEIIYRDFYLGEDCYFLKDFSRFGTLVYLREKWQKVLHQEIPLSSGIKIKFGSIHGDTLEFIIENKSSEN